MMSNAAKTIDAYELRKNAELAPLADELPLLVKKTVPKSRVLPAEPHSPIPLGFSKERERTCAT